MTTPDIARMSVKERIDLISDLWDSLTAEGVTLTPEQEAQLSRRMAAFAPFDDLAWAKPYVEEAIAGVERGEVIALDEHNARMNALMDMLDRR